LAHCLEPKGCCCALLRRRARNCAHHHRATQGRPREPGCGYRARVGEVTAANLNSRVVLDQVRHQVGTTISHARPSARQSNRTSPPIWPRIMVSITLEPKPLRVGGLTGGPPASLQRSMSCPSAARDHSTCGPSSPEACGPSGRTTSQSELTRGRVGIPRLLRAIRLCSGSGRTAYVL